MKYINLNVNHICIMWVNISSEIEFIGQMLFCYNSVNIINYLIFHHQFCLFIKHVNIVCKIHRSKWKLYSIQMCAYIYYFTNYILINAFQKHINFHNYYVQWTVGVSITNLSSVMYISIIIASLLQRKFNILYFLILLLFNNQREKYYRCIITNRVIALRLDKETF